MHAVLSLAVAALRCAALRCTLRRCTTLHGCVPAVRQLPIRSRARADGGALERQAAIRGCAARRPVTALCREYTEDARGAPSTPGPIRYLQSRLLCGGNGALAADAPGRWVPVLGVCRCAVLARVQCLCMRVRTRCGAGFVDGCTTIYASEGVAGLFKGKSPSPALCVACCRRTFRKQPLHPTEHARDHACVRESPGRSRDGQ